MKKLIIVVMVLLCSLPSYLSRATNHKATETECTGANTLQFGVKKIPLVPGWSNAACFYEAGHEEFNLTGELVDIAKLVDENYSIGANGNKLNWWIQAWAFEDEYCIDDSNASDMITNNSCIEVTSNTGICNTDVTLQVVGECDACVNGSVGGTWYKGNKVMDPTTAGGLNCSTDDSKLISLVLQVRTDCGNTGVDWGCGPDEMN